VTGSGALPADTVSVIASTPAPAPQLTSSMIVPVAEAGIVAEKLKLPLPSAVPEPTVVPATEALTAPSGWAPDPLTVTVWPAAGVSSDTVALQPP
jgi:hypothetical protein